MRSKIYFVGTLILAIAYFLDVFIGMFMIQRSYTSNNGKLFDGDSRYQAIFNEECIIIEIVLLAIMVVEDVSKLALCTRLTGKKVLNISFKY
jgi:hypothetical protein